MSLEKALISLEEQFWKGDSIFYKQNLAENCLMVFPEPVGLLDKEHTIRAISGGQRWAAVDLLEPQVVRLGESAAILTYKAVAEREGESTTYSARTTSSYARENGAWKLAFHQQTPIINGH